MESRAARERARVAAAMVEGWLNERQGAALFDAAASCTGRGAIVEIGSWKGRSTVWLAFGARLAGQEVLAIDPHVDSREDPAARTLADFEANLERAGIRDVVRPRVLTSEQAAGAIGGPVEVLFVDGDHSTGGSQADADLWLPRLVDGGTVLMHDVATASYTGPRHVFRRRICWNQEFDNIRRVGSMGIARRVARRSLPQGAWGVLAGLLLYLLDAKAALKRIKHRERLVRSTP